MTRASEAACWADCPWPAALAALAPGSAATAAVAEPCCSAGADVADGATSSALFLNHLVDAVKHLLHGLVLQHVLVGLAGLGGVPQGSRMLVAEDQRLRANKRADTMFNAALM